MTLAELRAPTKTLAKWLAATTSLVFAFSRFLPTGHPGATTVLTIPGYKCCTWLSPSDSNLVGTSCLRSARGVTFTADITGEKTGPSLTAIQPHCLFLRLLHYGFHFPISSGTQSGDVKNFVGRGAVLAQHDRGHPPGEQE